MGESFAYWGTTLELFRIIGVCTGKGYGLWQVPGDSQIGRMGPGESFCMPCSYGRFLL